MKAPEKNLAEDAQYVQSLRRLLDEARAEYEILVHTAGGPLYSPEDGVRAGLGSLAEMAPAFLLKTEQGALVAVIPGDRRLSYKKIKKELRLRDVSLASPKLTLELTGARVGTLSPLAGRLADSGIPTLVDVHLLEHPYVFGGCGEACCTLKIRPSDLARITEARLFDFTEEKTQR